MYNHALLVDTRPSVVTHRIAFDDKEVVTSPDHLNSRSLKRDISRTRCTTCGRGASRNFETGLRELLHIGSCATSQNGHEGRN